MWSVGVVLVAPVYNDIMRGSGLVAAAARGTRKRRRGLLWRAMGAVAVVSAVGSGGYYLQADYATRRKIGVQWEGVQRFVR